MDIKRLSNSKLKKFDDCPHQLWLSEKGVEQTDALNLNVGKYVHSVIEHYIKYCIDCTIQSDIMFIPEIARSVYTTQYQATIPFSVARETQRNILDTFSDCHVVPNAKAFIGSELRLAVCDGFLPVKYDAPDAWLRGIVDLAYYTDATTIRVVDYKTAWHVEPDWRQGKIYAALAFAHYPEVDTVEVEFDFLRFNVQRTDTFGRDTDLPEIEEEILEVAEAISLSNGEPRPGAACDKCRYIEHCEYTAVTPNAILSPGNAADTARTIARLEAELNLHKNALKTWCQENGPVQINGLEFGYHARGGVGFDDARAFADTAHANGADPWPFLSVNGVAVKKLAKRGVYPEYLQPLLVNKRSVAFTANKTEGDDDAD